MEKAKFTLRIEQEKLNEMKIMAIRHNMKLNELIEFIYDNYAESIHSLDEKYNLNKYGKNKKQGVGAEPLQL